MKKFVPIALGMLVFAGVSEKEVLGMYPTPVGQEVINYESMFWSALQVYVKEKNSSVLFEILRQVKENSELLRDGVWGAAVIEATEHDDAVLLNELYGIYGYRIFLVVDTLENGIGHLAVKKRDRNIIKWLKNGLLTKERVLPNLINQSLESVADAIDGSRDKELVEGLGSRFTGADVESRYRIHALSVYSGKSVEQFSSDELNGRSYDGDVMISIPRRSFRPVLRIPVLQNIRNQGGSRKGSWGDELNTPQSKEWGYENIAELIGAIRRNGASGGRDFLTQFKLDEDNAFAIILALQNVDNDSFAAVLEYFKSVGITLRESSRSELISLIKDPQKKELISSCDW